MRDRSLLSVLAGVSLLASTAPALAQNSFTQVNLVSDQTGKAALTDPNLVNAWGLAPSGSGVFWTSNNGTGTSTLYRPDGSKVALTVIIPGGANTGVDVTDPAAEAFEIPSGDTTARAQFIFVSENGTISAWSSRVDQTHAITVATTPDAIYKGLALARTPSGPRLYAANFHAGTIDVFDRAFKPLSLPGAFVDPSLPSGYGPFNVANIAGRLYVAYAQQDDDREDEIAGAGLGFIDAFDRDGVFLRRLVSQGALDAPWGMVLAPPTYGPFGGELLVGNFGDGRINAFSLATGALVGALEDDMGNPISIEGLWGLHFGLAVSGPVVANRLYFAAGPAGESHGLFGYLQANGAEVCVNRAADAEFWGEQCERAIRVPRHGDWDRGHKPRGASADSLRALAACATIFSRSFGASGCFTAGCDLLSVHAHSDARTRAAREFLALEMDRCAGLVCDSAVVFCPVRLGHDEDAFSGRGDDDDHRGGRHHRPPPSGLLTVADVVTMIDTSLCAVASKDSLEALAELARCAIRSAHGFGHDRDEDLVGPDGTTDPTPAMIAVRPLGDNPARLSSGMGVRFVVSAPAAPSVRLGVYDAAGRLVAELLRDTPVAGSTVVRWDGTNTHGLRVPSGTYFYRAIAGASAVGGRIVVLH
jgi:uncharacterized protein (TIGR03118 family)